jgi:SAM-dependent methyltransferase
LGANSSVLDVGGGSRPSLPAALRPPHCFYAGLDLSADEMAKAGSGAYDEMHVASATTHLAELDGRFDLVASFQVLEHVRPLDVALENMRSYLRPGGRLVALVSGSFALFSVIGRLIPHRVATVLLDRLLRRDPETVFPAHYDRCHFSALVALLRTWTWSEVIPLYRGAEYFSFSSPLQRAYVAYENWAFSRRHRNLATHYLIDAVR